MSQQIGYAPARGASIQLASQRRMRFFRKKIVPWLFVLPILLINIVVVIGPSFSAIYYSMTEWSGIGAAEFVGLRNYQELFFEDRSYLKAFQNNLKWMAIAITIPFAIALLAAGLLAPLKRGGMLIRTALFIPYVLPSVISTSIWRNLLSSSVGLGAMLAKLGIEGLDIAYLGNSSTALYAVAFVNNWHRWGFLMVLFLAAMQNIEPELYESARIDGANRWQEFLNVTLPGIRPTVIFMLLMTAIWSFLVFEYVWILTEGGPAGSTEVFSTLVFKHAFQRFEAGYASAIGLTLSLYAGLFVLLFIYLRRKGWEI